METLHDKKSLWDSVLAEAQLSVSDSNFKTWFSNTFIVKQNDDEIVIGVPNQFVKNWLSKKFHSEIVRILRDLAGDIRHVEYTIAVYDKEKEERSSHRKIIQTKKDFGELPLQDHYTNKESNLNPRYTFDNFVVGPFNELAHAASTAVISQPGIVYNPLFFHGSTGHGKTHLLQAVGNQIQKNFKDKKIFYMTAETFSNDLVNAIQQNKMTLFKERYKKYDVLIMDDIQFLSKKEKTQEELFHIFNSLYDNNKQIIFSSDKHPNYIPHLENRLKSRFNQGMTVDIPRPDSEARNAILRRKAELMNLELENEIIEYLSETVDGNVRDIEGILNSISCQMQLKNKSVCLSDIKNMMKGSSKPKKMVSVSELIKLVSEFYNAEVEDVCGRTRKKEVVRPRQVIMYILREDFSSSYPTIGELLGKRDHTTVIHSYEKVKKELETDSHLLQQITQLREMI